jgi:hypothetical protein
VPCGALDRFSCQDQIAIFFRYAAVGSNYDLSQSFLAVLHIPHQTQDIIEGKKEKENKKSNTYPMWFNGFDGATWLLLCLLNPTKG